MILPGSKIGVMGSGQLGRMFAIAAHRMGYRVSTYSPEKDTPMGLTVENEIVGAYDDLKAIETFARSVDVVTFEFENIPAGSVECACAVVPVRPGVKSLYIAQHRTREKSFLTEKGYPTIPYRRVTSLPELQTAIDILGLPVVLKTAGMGYDGKGQVKIEKKEQAESALAKLGAGEAIAEAWVSYSAEASVIGARTANGDFSHWGLIENQHRNHILDISILPSPFAESLANEAIEITRQLMSDLEMVGLLCVEFFITEQGKLLVNELAPRPHNSGHLTIDANYTSQFEQQVRAICDLPLGDTGLIVPGAAMANLLGEVWDNGEPGWSEVLKIPHLKLHLYGKSQARPGRKMGHLTVLGKSGPEAAKIAKAARERLAGASLTRRQ